MGAISDENMNGIPLPRAARQLGLDPATLRRDIQRKGCPVVRKGRKGPGGAALLDVDAVRLWRERTLSKKGPSGPTPDDILLKIAEALRQALNEDRADIRAGIEKSDIAAAFIVLWDRLCTTFGKTYPFDQQPEPIRALAREL